MWQYIQGKVRTWDELEEVLEYLGTKAACRSCHDVLGHLDPNDTSVLGGKTDDR